MSDDKLKEIFSKNLNALLDKRHLTQKQFAILIDEKPQTINSWATGTSLPRMGRIQKIAEFFKIKKSELLEEWTEEKLNSFEEENILYKYRKLKPKRKQELKEYLDNLVRYERFLAELEAYDGITEDGYDFDEVVDAYESGRPMPEPVMNPREAFEALDKVSETHNETVLQAAHSNREPSEEDLADREEDIKEMLEFKNKTKG